MVAGQSISFDVSYPAPLISLKFVTPDYLNQFLELGIGDSSVFTSHPAAHSPIPCPFIMHPAALNRFVFLAFPLVYGPYIGQFMTTSSQNEPDITIRIPWSCPFKGIYYSQADSTVCCLTHCRSPLLMLIAYQILL